MFTSHRVTRIRDVGLIGKSIKINEAVTIYYVFRLKTAQVKQTQQWGCVVSEK